MWHSVCSLQSVRWKVMEVISHSVKNCWTSWPGEGSSAVWATFSTWCYCKAQYCLEQFCSYYLSNLRIVWKGLTISSDVFQPLLPPLLLLFSQQRNNNSNNSLMSLYPGRPRVSQVHSHPPCLCGYYTTSLIKFLHFLWSIASSLHNCRVWQSFYDLAIFLGLPRGIMTSTSKSMHFFTQSFSSFLKTCPYYLNLCYCITVIISPIHSLALNLLLKNPSVILMPHINLISAHWSVNSFSFFTGHVSLPCNLQLCTQLVYNFPRAVS